MASAVHSIADLPFHERPVLELLHLAAHRVAPDRDYAGYGWARVPRVWLTTPMEAARPVDDALVLALHSADDAEVLADDIELYFELDAQVPVTVLASRFLARWLPRLPQDAAALVLVLCNPHHAILPPFPVPLLPLAPLPLTAVPVFYAHGDVESWLERTAAGDHRLELLAPAWSTVPS